MGRVCRWGVFFTLLMAFALPAHAVDPLVMFLLGFARNVIERQSTQPDSAGAPAASLPEGARTYPGTAVEPAILRRLIDDSFIYLSSEQRKEIFDALNKVLLDPKNAAVRGTMIEHFARRALAVRATQVRLSQLSYREKEMLAQEFKQEIQGVPDADIAQIRGVIEKGLLPVPGDLNRLFLNVLEAREINPSPQAPLGTVPPAAAVPPLAAQPAPGS